MSNFLLSILTFSASVFITGIAIRYGLKAAGKLDDFFSDKTRRNFTGFNWYYRIPLSVGFIPEYFFYLVIGAGNYFKTNWWTIKTASFISVLLAVALLNSRSAVFNYYSLHLLLNEGVAALFISDSFVWFLNFITLLYLGLLTLIIIESIKMHGYYSPFRIFVYSLLSALMTVLTITMLSLLLIVTVIYIAVKVIRIIFFSKNKSHSRVGDDEEISGTLRRNIAVFKAEVKKWENEVKLKKHERKEEKKPKVRITRKKNVSGHTYKSDIPRLHPD